jgi:hypothetical protein
MNVANATCQEVSYRVQHEVPAQEPEAGGAWRALSSGDVVAVPESWTVEFFFGGRIIARRTVFDPAAVVRLVERNGAFEVEVMHSRSRAIDSEGLIESMLPVSVPSAVAVLQARRNALAREKLFQEFGALTSAEVADLAGSRAANKAALAHRWRQEGRIFSLPHRGAHYFPGFQFDEQGQPIAAVAEVIRRLGERLSEWGLAMWLTASNGWLGGRRPVELLHEEPDAVVNAADQETAGLVF